MKNLSLLVLAGCLSTSSLLAQTADDYVTMGRTNLAAHNLAAANADFTTAVTLSPNNANANALLAVTRLLVMPQQPTGSNFLNRIGFSASGRDLFNWTATLPQDTNGDTVLPANYNSSEAIVFYRTNIMVALAQSRTNLARITDPAFTLYLTADETSSSESVTVDYGDILLLQALERAGEFAGYTLNAHNFSVVINHLRDLDKTNGLTIQRVLADYPSLLTQSSASDLAASKVALTNAISLYFAASDFIRNVRAPGVERLFELAPDEINNEAQFRTELTNTLLSLNGPVIFDTNAAFSLSLSNYFTGAKTLRSLTPQFNGNRYVNNTLPDYTFGGILVDEPACEVESLFRDILGRSYAGIYIGDMYDYYYNYLGSYAVIVRTNQQATVVGYDEIQENGIYFDFKVDDGGYWEFYTNDIHGWGNIYKDGFQDGEVDSSMGTAWLQGERQSALGSFQNAAGYYTGSWSASGKTGQLRAVLSADGRVYFCEFDSDGPLGDGGSGQINSLNHFTGSSMTGTELGGTLSGTTLSGNFTNQNMTGTFSFTRSANVPFDLPPTITSPPTSKIAPLGTNVTFSVVASGSPPLCYQWYSNDVAIAHATNTSLSLTNVQYASVASYSVAVRNVAGEADATASLLISPPQTVMLPVATNASVIEVSFGLATDGTNYLVGFSSGTNICAQLLSPNGTPIGSALILGGGAGIMPPQAQVVSSRTSYLVIWSDTNISSGVDMFGQFVSRSGAKIGSKFQLLSSYGTHGFQAIESAASDGTNFLVAWQDQKNLTGISTNNTYGQLVTASGALSGSEFLVAKVGAALEAQGVTVAFGKTNYLASWQSGDASYYQYTNDGHYVTYGAFISPGGAVSDPFPISQVHSPDNNFSPGMAFDGDNFLVVWNRNVGKPDGTWDNEWVQYGRLVSQNGTFPGDEVFMSGAWSMMPSIAFDGSDYLMAWNFNLTKADQNIHFRFFDRSLNPAGTEFVLFSTQGTNAPLSPWNGVIFDGKQFVVAATLGVWITNSGLRSADVYDAFLPASGGATTPAILVQPSSRTNATGTMVTFSVSVAGLPPLGYQWQMNGTNLANGARIFGATTGSLTISNLAMTDAGNYSVTVGNSIGNAPSSNAVLTVYIPDTTKPTSAITMPTSGLQVSNVSYTLTGTAGDNVQVSNVFYSLNNTGWSNAVTGNHWTNWTAGVTLSPGTNIVQAYAMDTSGNVSTTNTVSFVYVMSAMLAVNINGLGTVSPNYNGTLLQIGKSFSMTATAGTGFSFTGWTGSFPTNGAILTFTMASNLTFTANFADVTKPTLSITNLALGQRVSNAVFTVRGTASDNWQLGGVQYQLNGTGWSNAAPVNNWTNWSAGVTFVPGTNVVQAYAVDTTGNKSITNSVSVQFVVTNQLGVRARGLGTLYLNYSNAWLEIGRNYTMLATPGVGFIFTNWVISTNWIGGVQTNNATVQFMMESNLTLQVSFTDVTKPTLTITAPIAGQKMTNALGKVTGTTTDNWGVTNVWYQWNTNAWSMATTTNGYTNWTVTLPLIAGTNTIKAFAVDLGANASLTNSVSFYSSNSFQLQLGFNAGPPMAGNGLSFSLQVSPGLVGRIEASTNLANWMTLTNFAGTNATINFRDATVTNFNHRFYRAVTP